MDYSVIESANPHEGNRPTVAVGECELEIELVEVKPPPNIPGKDYGVSLIVEVKVLSSENPLDPPGALRKISFTGLDKPAKAKLLFGRIKSLIAACWGISPDLVQPGEGWTWTSAYEHLISEKAPFQGSRVHASSEERQAQSINQVTRDFNKYRVWTFSPSTK